MIFRGEGRGGGGEEEMVKEEEKENWQTQRNRYVAYIFICPCVYACMHMYI